MNTRQKVIAKLQNYDIEISSNELEAFIFQYKQTYGNKFSGIDLLFDMIDEESELLKFVEFVKNRMPVRPCGHNCAKLRGYECVACTDTKKAGAESCFQN